MTHVLKKVYMNLLVNVFEKWSYTRRNQLIKSIANYCTFFYNLFRFKNEDVYFW